MLGTWYHLAKECKKIGVEIRSRIDESRINFNVIANERGECSNLCVIEQVEKVRKLER